MYSYFSRWCVTTNSVAPPPLYKLHTTHNSLIRSDEGLTLETSAFRIPVRWSIYIINSVDKTNFSGIIAQLVRASHRYREVTGSNPVEVLNFF